MSRALFIFNPTCEMAVANGQVSYMPPAHLQQFENNLATIPCFFGNEEDCVVTQQPVPSSYIENLKELGFKLPHFIQKTEDILPDNLPFSIMRPWGWSPAVHRILKPFQCVCNNEWLDNPMHQWQPQHKLLLSRESGFRLISQINNSDIKNYDLVEIPQLPLKLTSLEDIEDIINKIQIPALIKTPWSASGRGLFKIRDINEDAVNNRWVKSKLKQQGFLFAEPFLDKIIDLSFHFWISRKEVNFLGYNFFKTDPSGQFIGCFTNMPKHPLIEESFLEEVINQGSQLLTKALIKLNINDDYQGPAGIDSILFRNGQNKIRLHPCIEINLRHSMGLLNINLRKHIHPLSRGEWHISMIDNKEWEQIELQHNKVTKLNDGLIAKGVVALTPAPINKGFMAWLKMES